jgi:hypothetical protein
MEMKRRPIERLRERLEVSPEELFDVRLRLVWRVEGLVARLRERESNVSKGPRD